MAPLLIAFAATAASVQASPGTRPDPIVPADDLTAAIGALATCGGPKTGELPTCDLKWRGTRVQVTNGRTGEITQSTGRPWFFDCQHDRADDDYRCSFSTGDEFAIGLAASGHAAVVIGIKRAPGSRMVVRFDGRAPMSSSDRYGFSQAVSDSIVRRMSFQRKLFYKWTDWPTGKSRGTSDPIDLEGFPAVIAMAKAVLTVFQVGTVMNEGSD